MIHSMYCMNHFVLLLLVYTAACPSNVKVYLHANSSVPGALWGISRPVPGGAQTVFFIPAVKSRRYPGIDTYILLYDELWMHGMVTLHDFFKAWHYSYYCTGPWRSVHRVLLISPCVVYAINNFVLMHHTNRGLGLSQLCSAFPTVHGCHAQGCFWLAWETCLDNTVAVENKAILCSVLHGHAWNDRAYKCCKACDLCPCIVPLKRDMHILPTRAAAMHFVSVMSSAGATASACIL